MQYATLLLDAEYRVLFSTRYSETVTPENLHGKLVWESVHMPEESAQAIRDCLARVDADGKPHSYEMRSYGTGTWRTTVYPCPMPVIRYLLESRQMPPALATLTPEQREFCRLYLVNDSKRLASVLGCTVQGVGYKRAKIAAQLSVDPADLRCHLAAYRFWLE